MKHSNDIHQIKTMEESKNVGCANKNKVHCIQICKYFENIYVTRLRHLRCFMGVGGASQEWVGLNIFWRNLLAAILVEFSLQHHG